jgi:hypothetical protein
MSVAGIECVVLCVRHSMCARMCQPYRSASGLTPTQSGLTLPVYEALSYDKLLVYEALSAPLQASHLPNEALSY